METILVVDDEPMIRGVLNAVLTSHGFRVLMAASGMEALQICEEHNDEIDLLLTDIKMPGMDGRELARKLGPSQPNMRVLYMSGFADEISQFAAQLSEGSEFLAKPFTNSMLMGRIFVMLTKIKRSTVKPRSAAL